MVAVRSVPKAQGEIRLEMADTIFFAWQLDTPSAQNKAFIWEALKRAATSLTPAYGLDLAPRPERDTDGVAGSPNIVDTIFKRIRNCAVFVADLTLTAKTESGKQCPNPNVLIELGYAARSVGWDRVVLVMNERHGPAGHLPFDVLQHRWPLRYRSPDRSDENRITALSADLRIAIESCQRQRLIRADEMADLLDTATISLVARFENSMFIDMQLPPLTMGQLLTSLEQVSAIRQLISLGALRVTHTPTVGYSWTYDGRKMIEALKAKQPRLLNVFRQHGQQSRGNSP